MLYLIIRDSAVREGVQTCINLIVSPAKSMLSGVITQKCYRKQGIAPRIAWRLQFPHMWADYSVTAVLVCSVLLKYLTVVYNPVTWLWNFSSCCNCKSFCRIAFFKGRKVGKIKWKLFSPSSSNNIGPNWGTVEETKPSIFLWGSNYFQMRKNSFGMALLKFVFGSLKFQVV